MPTDIEIGERAVSGALDDLINVVRRIVRAEKNATRAGTAIAELLPAYLERGDLLSGAHLPPDPAGYRQHILHVEPDESFSIAALVWLPGQATPIHDHVSWCVVGVCKGNEYETRYELHDDGSGEPFLTPGGLRVNRAGSVEALIPPGDIHKVANDGDGVAISLHIYGANLDALGCSIRRRYDLPVRSTIN